MTFTEIIEQLRDGKRYEFTHPNLAGFFHKAPFPHQRNDFELDGALSAITYYGVDGGMRLVRSSPVFLLDDFDRKDWVIKLTDKHPLDRNAV